MAIAKKDFLDGMEKIWAAFGKSAMPSTAVADAIYQRIHDLPQDFLAYAVNQIRDLEKLPANLGAYMRRELWPQYYETHPAIWTRGQTFSCHRCKHDDPGIKQFWSPDGETHLCACDCCTDRRRIELLGKIPDEELISRGYLTERPYRPKSEFIREIEAKLGRALGEHRQRPAHADYLNRMEEPDAQSGF